MNEQRKIFLSVAVMLLAIFTISETFDIEALILPQSIEEDTVGRYHVMIEYITHSFCVDNSYRFNHIYVERSLSTGLADVLINRMNKCMAAGILVSR